jgi:hypothetical protein
MITDGLVKQLQKEKYSEEHLPLKDNIEMNLGVAFPGFSLELVLDKQVKDINQRLGGRLCTDKEIVFVEVKADKGFTFKFSSDKTHYAKCKGCSKVGLIDKIPCICNEITYCSESCRDKDTTHKEQCYEIKRREFDPQFINFEVAEEPCNGMVGLQNIGNTCYMNSALQCLSNTPELVNYFCKLMLFKEDLNKQNPLASSNNEIAILFARFLDRMWNHPKGGVFNPMILKRAIGMKNSLFKGNSQHDSNELIQFLLDQLHEDLNRVKIKPYIEMPSDDQIQKQHMTDEQLAVFFNEVHLKRNESIIQDMIFGQFKSIVICDNCKTESKKIEQFLTVPVNIPQQNFDLKFFFVPFLPNERIFSYELKGLSMIEQILPSGESTLSLLHLKRRILSVIKQFYFKDTHLDPKSKQQVKYPLTTHIDEEGMVDMSPHELILASVGSINNSVFKFSKIFGDHKHSLIDIQQSLG